MSNGELMVCWFVQGAQTKLAHVLNAGENINTIHGNEVSPKIYVLKKYCFLNFLSLCINDNIILVYFITLQLHFFTPGFPKNLPKISSDTGKNTFIDQLHHNLSLVK